MRWVSGKDETSVAMRLHNILNLDPEEPIFLAENSFSDLKQAPLTEKYLEELEGLGDISSTRPVQLVDRNDCAPIALAVYVHSQGFDHWLVLTNIISKDECFGERVRALTCNCAEEIETDAKSLREAVVEYYSIFLRNQWLCESCAREDLPYLDIGSFASARELLNEITEDPADDLVGGLASAEAIASERNVRLSRILRDLGLDLSGDGAGAGSGADVLEICCGDGSATEVLRDLGYDPISIDYDRCGICDGLRSGRLRENRSIVLDATELTHFFMREFDCVFGFMVGPIQSFNEDMWETILRESTKVVRLDGVLVFTFYDREELEFAEKILGSCGIIGVMFENLPDIGYDRWVYVGRWTPQSTVPAT